MGHPDNNLFRQESGAYQAEGKSWDRTRTSSLEKRSATVPAVYLNGKFPDTWHGHPWASLHYLREFDVLKQRVQIITDINKLT